MAKKFNLFYSWQSDLPGNETRWFLQKCIDGAVSLCRGSMDGVEVIADRDTQGKTGSPDIVQSIFAKIDACDLFIADVSIVNKYTSLEVGEGKTVKFSPNPNVLIELGYAVKVLGWDNVICFVNTDYGQANELPFDLDHHRVTGYSLNQCGKTSPKAAEEKRLRDIIVVNIMEIAARGTRVKGNHAFHKVGSYNPGERCVQAVLAPRDVAHVPEIERWFADKKRAAAKLLEKISMFEIPEKEDASQQQTGVTTLEKLFPDSLEKRSWMLNGLPGFSQDDGYMDCKVGAVWREKISRLASKYLDEQEAFFDEAFFNLGGLRIQKYALAPRYGKAELLRKGTEQEKEKYDRIQELSETLEQMECLELYLKTFDDVLLFPLAIENVSAKKDTNITITISVEGDYEGLVFPDEGFIHPEVEKDRVVIYQMGILQGLLTMPEDGDIQYERDMFYNPEERFHGNVMPGVHSPITEKDYGYVIRNYIAAPLSGHEYQFEIDSLRANERKWLDGMVAVRGVGAAGISMQYRIKSDQTDGNVEGILVYDGRKNPVKQHSDPKFG